jgi:hypothetical protein
LLLAPLFPLIANDEGVLHSNGEPGRSVNHVGFKENKGFNQKLDLRHPLNKIAPKNLCWMLDVHPISWRRQFARREGGHIWGEEEEINEGS